MIEKNYFTQLPLPLSLSDSELFPVDVLLTSNLTGYIKFFSIECVLIPI